MRKERPRFSVEAEKCIAIAKVLARRESKARLDSYPRNCNKVVDTIVELEHAEILKWTESDGRVFLSDAVCLSPLVRSELLVALATDPISDADLRSARRKLNASGNDCFGLWDE